VASSTTKWGARSARYVRAWPVSGQSLALLDARSFAIANLPRPAGNPGKENRDMKKQKRTITNKYDGMNKEQIIAKILEDVKSFFGPQDEKFAEVMYEELVANGTIKEK
jgi:hypothetical protein